MLRCLSVTLVCWFAFFAIPVRADTVRTTDGRTFIGLIMKDDETGVTIFTVVDGVRGKVAFERNEVASVTKEPLPAGFGNASKATTQPVPATQTAIRSLAATQTATQSPALDRESETQVGRLRKDVEKLSRDLADMRRQLGKTPATTDTHRVLPGETMGDLFRKRPPEPNPDYLALKKQIQQAQDVIKTKNKQILDISNGGVGRQTALEAIKKADDQTAQAQEDRANVLVELQRCFADPVVTADEAVAVLLDSKVILEASTAQSKEALHPRKAVLFKSLLFGMSTAAKDYSAVAAAKPETSFYIINYNFKFITQNGLERHNQGSVLMCKIDGIWWPLQVNIDGYGAYWESFEHPVATPALLQRITKAVGTPAKAGGQLSIVGLKPTITLKSTPSAPAKGRE